MPANRWLCGMVAAGLVSASAIASTQAQETPEPLATRFLESLEVDLVSVEVEVTNAQGEPVAGLAAKNFQVSEDGKRVKISHFAYVEEAAAEPAGRTESAAESRADSPAGPSRHVVIYFDSFAIHPGNRLRAIEELTALVEADRSEDTQYAVAVYDGTFALHQPFTQDRRAVVTALVGLEQSSPLGVLRQRQREATIRSSLQMLRNIQSMAGSDTRGTEAARHLGEFTRQINDHAERIRRQNSGSFYSLSHVANAMAALPGRKAVIYVSEGLPMRPGAELYDALASTIRTIEPVVVITQDDESREAETARRSAALGAISDSSPRRGNNDQDTTNQGLTLLTALANSSGVSFYTYKVQGNVGGVQPQIAGDISELHSPQFKSTRESNLADTLRHLASETGGQAIIGGELETLFERARTDFSSHYSLGYAARASGDGELHRIKVKVKGRGLRARYRTSYIGKPLPVKLADRASTAMLFGVDDNPLGITLAVGKSRPAPRPGEAIVPVIIGVPLGGLDLVANGDEYGVDAILYIAAMAPDGHMAPVEEARLRITVPADRLESALTGIHTAQLELPLREGQQRVAIGFVDPAAGVTSFVSRDVEIDSSGPATSTPQP